MSNRKCPLCSSDCTDENGRRFSCGSIMLVQGNFFYTNTCVDMAMEDLTRLKSRHNSLVEAATEAAEGIKLQLHLFKGGDMISVDSLDLIREKIENSLVEEDLSNPGENCIYVIVIPKEESGGQGGGSFPYEELSWVEHGWSRISRMPAFTSEAAAKAYLESLGKDAPWRAKIVKMELR